MDGQGYYLSNWSIWARALRSKTAKTKLSKEGTNQKDQRMDGRINGAFAQVQRAPFLPVTYHSIRQSVCHTFLFMCFLRSLGSQPLPKYQGTLDMAPAHRPLIKVVQPF